MESKLIEALALVGFKPGDKILINKIDLQLDINDEGELLKNNEPYTEFIWYLIQFPHLVTKLLKYQEHDIELLKAANTLGYPYAARGKNGILCFYGTEPHKDIATWVTDDSYIIPVHRKNTDLSFIVWDDEKPLYIPDFLERLKAD